MPSEAGARFWQALEQERPLQIVGTINAYAKLEGPTLGRLQRVLITGDFFVTPPRVVFDLEAALAGARVEEIDAVVRQFFEESAVEMLSVGPEDFTAAINDALDSREGAR